MKKMLVSLTKLTGPMTFLRSVIMAVGPPIDSAHDFVRLYMSPFLLSITPVPHVACYPIIILFQYTHARSIYLLSLTLSTLDMTA